MVENKNRLFLLSLSHVRLCDLLECSPVGSSLHEILQARMLEWVAIFLLLPNPGLNLRHLCLLLCGWIFYLLSHRGSSKNRLRNGK